MRWWQKPDTYVLLSYIDFLCIWSSLALFLPLLLSLSIVSVIAFALQKRVFISILSCFVHNLDMMLSCARVLFTCSFSLVCQPIRIDNLQNAFFLIRSWCLAMTFNICSFILHRSPIFPIPECMFTEIHCSRACYAASRIVLTLIMHAKLLNE